MGTGLTSLDKMAHHNDVSIVGYHQNGILQRFSLGAAGHFWISKTNDTCSETISCSFKRQAGTGTRLEKECGNHLTLKQFTIRMTFKLLRHLNHVENFFAGQVGDSNKIVFVHN